jgi:hypothetical protein
MNASHPGCCQTPPACAGTFQDVTASNPFCVYIEALYIAGVISGCNASPLLYCPSNTVPRDAMAKFICNAMNVCSPGSCTITSCTGVFTDVDLSNQFCGFVEGIYNANIVSGCNLSPLQYCPKALVPRGQMSKFIVKAFGLAL